MEQLELSHIAAERIKWYLGNYLAISLRCKHTIPHYTTIPSLVFYAIKLEIFVHRKPCAQMFIAALIIVARS